MAEDDDVTGNRVVRQMEDRIRELERQLGRKTLEVDPARGSGQGTVKEPTWLARSPLKGDFQ